MSRSTAKVTLEFFTTFPVTVLTYLRAAASAGMVGSVSESESKWPSVVVILEAFDPDFPRRNFSSLLLLLNELPDADFAVYSSMSVVST